MYASNWAIFTATRWIILETMRIYNKQFKYIYIYIYMCMYIDDIRGWYIYIYRWYKRVAVGNRSWRIGQLNVTHATDWTFFLLGGRESHAFPSPLNPLMYPLILLPWCTGVSGEGFAKLASMMLRGTSLSGGCESLVDVYITGGCEGRIRQKTSCRGITKQVIDAIYPWVSNKIDMLNNISIII